MKETYLSACSFGDTSLHEEALPISLTGTFKKAKGRSKVRKPVASSSGGVHVKHKLELCINSSTDQNSLTHTAGNKQQQL